MTKRPVPKDVWLRFEITTDVPEPYDVRWQIVNTGRDAMLADGLRGDEFEESNGASNIRWEATEYRGTHWIEAFIIRRGMQKCNEKFEAFRNINDEDSEVNCPRCGARRAERVFSVFSTGSSGIACAPSRST